MHANKCATHAVVPSNPLASANGRRNVAKRRDCFADSAALSHPRCSTAGTSANRGDSPERILLLLVCLMASMSSLSCSTLEGLLSDEKKDRLSQSSAADKRAAKTDYTSPYPKGRWRFAKFEELNRVVFWLSHIVISHRGALPHVTPLRFPTWRPDVIPDRSADEASGLARHLAKKLKEDPSVFELLASQYSDDVVTRGRGGSLGGVRASQLPRPFLDALDVLKAGQVSLPVQTEFGYHIILRRQQPKPELISARRIVIGYKGTFFPRSGTTRARKDAFALAQRVSAQIRDGVSFDSLVAKYSDSDDAARGGDMGVWSVHDPKALSAQTDVLAGLREGDLAEPLDSRQGLQLLQRIKVTDRPPYAATAIRLRFDQNAPAEDPNSKQSVKRKADALAKRLQSQPQTFASLQEEYCCDRVESWTLGSGPVGISEVLDELDFGEFTPKPILRLGNWAIVKRLDPALQPKPKGPLHKLPKPDAPNLDSAIAGARKDLLIKFTKKLRTDARKVLDLDTATEQAFCDVLDRLLKTYENDLGPNERVAAAYAAMAETKKVLGATKYQEYSDFIREWSAREFLPLMP